MLPLGFDEAIAWIQQIYKLGAEIEFAGGILSESDA
jgi:hypothetical protein